jgi:GAF domain-containing protein
MLDFVSAAGGNAEDITGLRVRVSDSLSNTVVSTGKPIMIDGRVSATTGNLFSDLPNYMFVLPSQSPPGSSQVTAQQLGLQPQLSGSGVRVGASVSGARTALVAPILEDGKLIGTISGMNKRSTARDGLDEPFDSEDLEILELFADSVALARKVNQSAALGRELARELAVMYDAAQNISASLNIQRVLDSVLKSICTQLEHQTIVLFLFNDERTHLFIAAERGLSEEEREVQLAVDSGAHVSVLDNGVPCLVEASDDDPTFDQFSANSRSRSVMIAPMRSRNETHGLIIVSSLQRKAYQNEDLKLLAAVATQAGTAIDNAFLFEQVQRQAQEVAALYELSQHLNSTLHLDKVFAYIADSVINLLKVDKFALMLFDQHEEVLITRIVRNIDFAQFRLTRPRRGEGIAGWVYDWQTPQAVADVAADPRNSAAPLDRAVDVASTLCVPLQVGDEVIGVIHAMSVRRRLFTVAEMELLYTIANQAASAITNATTFQEARARSHEMRRYFSRVARAIGSTLEEQDLPRLLADLSVEIMRADRCAVYRVEGDKLRLNASSRFRSSVPADVEVPLGEGLCGWVARKRKSLVIGSLEDDPRSRWHSWMSKDRMASYLAVPIRSDRRVVGVVELYTLDPREYTREEVQLFTTFVRRARVAEKLIMERL